MCRRFDDTLFKVIEYSSKGYLGTTAWWVRYFHGGLLLRNLSITHILLLRLLVILAITKLLLLDG